MLIRTILILLIVSPLGFTVALPTPVRAADERLVLAFYYAWFDANAWNSGTLAGLPQTPYNSDDTAAMARQIDQAKGAGIDAFVLNWWGKGNRTEKNLKAMLDVAAGKGFRVAVDFDINSPVMGGPDSYADNLRHLLSVHAAHPAYLRHRGRPVVFFYNVSRLPVATWQSIRDRADPERGAIWIAEGVDLAYQSVFDGHHLYSTTWPNRIPPAQTLPKWGNKVRKYNADHGTAKLWVATVMPGYDDRKVRPQNGFARSRDGGDYYRQHWDAAIASRPAWIIINSFNEWAEGSHIEPSQAFGGQYLDITREWSGRFKGAEFVESAPALSPTTKPSRTAGPVPTAAATDTPEPTLTPTATASPTAEPPTATATASPTPSPTPTATPTAPPPSETPTASATRTATRTPVSVAKADQTPGALPPTKGQHAAGAGSNPAMIWLYVSVGALILAVVVGGGMLLLWWRGRLRT